MIEQNVQFESTQIISQISQHHIFDRFCTESLHYMAFNMFLAT